VAKYLRLFLAQLRTALLVSLQYRADFLLDGAIEILWTSTALAPLLVVFRLRDGIAGWSFGEALVVVGFFTLLQAVLEGAFNPSFVAVVEHVRRGTLDFVLLKPADAQFLVSTSRFHLWRSVNVITALAIFVIAFRALGRAPSLADVAKTIALFCAGVTVLYSIWTLAMCTVFFAVKTDNITDVFSAVFDAARWPSTVFRGAVRFVITFLVPLAVMTTVPARALLGTLDGGLVTTAIAQAIGFAIVARIAWVRSLARYTSASS
jgi:ABC-2 type transport system permease protein